MPGVGLVSGSVFVEGRSFAVAEGYTGSLAAQYEQSNWFVEGYGGYYGALKRKTADTYDSPFTAFRLAGFCPKKSESAWSTPNLKTSDCRATEPTRASSGCSVLAWVPVFACPPSLRYRPWAG
ncbi:hypothetical protein [Dyadobacter arcticus]|uniref:Uncharacterized protein n=1 Tax=Dyadobacter arcticus TaxID=1078754 RepID=A0ABX0UGW6_9BACT|nr:hypothetical protein [Dyadobacter arcticus]NIJ52246.1 hypothetical protein [Dyadobacter arcticus]